MRLKSRNSVIKNTKVAGGGIGRHAEYVQKNKIKHFVQLFEAIRKKVGNYEEARKLVRLSHDEMSRMKSGARLSALHGRRILDTYRNIIKDEKI